MNEIYDSILIMKIGPQGEENLPEIIERKNREAEIPGFAYWGYGGVNCSPLRVQNWVKELKKEGKSVKVLFSITPSLFHGTHIPDAKELSEDNVSWYHVSQETRITVSKYALVLKNLRESNFALDLNAYEIAVGPSRGKILTNYLKGQSDKALAQRINHPIKNDTEIKERKISFTADVVEPYAVFVR